MSLPGINISMSIADDHVIWGDVAFSNVRRPANLAQEEKIVILPTRETRRRSHLWMIFDKHLQFPTTINQHNCSNTTTTTIVG